MHWQDLKYKTWIPGDKATFWSILHQYRLVYSKRTPIKDINNNFFRMDNTKPYEEFLHIIDKEMAGNFMGINNFTEKDKEKFITRNLIEESIASSQLEGANTSRFRCSKNVIRKAFSY